MNNRVSSILSPNRGEYVSPFTAPAMPNLRTQGSAAYKPVVADSIRIPRSPLPPRKLAGLANALGVSTPLPASSPPSTASKRSFSPVQTAKEHTTSDSRSATPSSTAARPSTTKYFIHAIPPRHFPHESRKDPQAFSAFLRGSLVPLHATLQAQLSAISREFQLPTAHGLVLYLSSDLESNKGTTGPSGKGPRINDEVWKWLWMKITEEQPLMHGVGLGLMSGASSPAPSERPSLLRKFPSSPQLNSVSSTGGMPLFPLTSSSSISTSTSTSTLPQRKESKEDSSPLEQSSSSTFSTPALDTLPTTSSDLDSRLLPGLGSSSLIPVLAKVEFDIDRKVGTWYEAWSRSRKNNQKRKIRKVDPQGKLRLRITIKNKNGSASPLSSSSNDEDEGYKRLSESPDITNPRDVLTTRVSSRDDPLVDVFGTDGETWSGLSGGTSRGDIALDGATLSALADSESNDPRLHVSDKDEVIKLWNDRGQPQLDGSSLKAGQHGMHKPIPPPLHIAAHRMDVEINVATATPSPYTANFSDNSTTRLPYLEDSQSSGENPMYKDKRVGGIYDDVDLDLNADFDMDDHRASQLRIRQELDVLERNLAQFSPRVLKSVELSPELTLPTSPLLRSAPAEKPSFISRSHHVVTPSVQMASNERGTKRVVTKIQHLHAARPSIMEMEDETASGPLMARQLYTVEDTDRIDTAGNSVDGSSTHGIHELAQVAWPAVPYTALASLSEDGSMSPKSLSSNPNPERVTNSPPKLTLNEKTNRSSKSPSDKRKDSLSVSSIFSGRSSPRNVSESQARYKQYEEEAGFYSEEVNLQPSLSRRAEVSESPVLPLSPDPFGRFPSSTPGESNAVTAPPQRTSSLAKQVADDGRRSHKAPSSRFSMDSVGEDSTSSTNLKVNNRTALMSMKSIKKLWRNKNKSSVSGHSPLASPDPSTMPSRPPSSAMSLQLTDVDMSLTLSPSISYSQTASSRVSAASMRVVYGQVQKSAKPSRPDSGLDPFYFDQDAQHPTRRSPSPQSQYQFPGPRAPSVSARAQMAPSTGGPEKRRSISRKSLAKRKSGSEFSSQTESTGSMSVSEPRRRRPSILDTVGLMQGSVSSVNGPSPSVPELPAEYRLSQATRAQARVSVSASGTLHLTEEKRVSSTSPMRRKPAPQSSTDSSQESTDPLRTPVSASALMSFPQGIRMVSPGASEGARSSFDDSQFEIVSPKTGRFTSAVVSSHTIDGEENRQ